MKIVGNHPGDYYDVGLSAGIDESILYVRNRPASALPDGLRADWSSYRLRAVALDGLHYWELEPIVVGFAGRVYFLFKLALVRSHFPLRNPRGTFERVQFREYLSPPYDGSLDYGRFQIGLKEIKLFKTLGEVEAYTSLDFASRFPKFYGEADKPLPVNPTPEFDFEPFYKVGAPIFVSGLIPNTSAKQKYYDRIYGFWKNPVLKDIGFQSILDPWTAFQELQMFVSCWAQPQDIVQITDDIVLRDAKGFDHMSFKTISPGKKRKRKK